ncbi:MAG: iron ABC transporter permease [Litorilinea sp.]
MFSAMNLRALRLRHLLYALPLLFLGGFFFMPLIAILRTSFVPYPGHTEQGGWAAIQDLISRPFLWRVIWFTIWQAAASTALTLLFGLPLAWLFARYRFPGKTFLRALTTVPFVMPSVVVGAAFTALLGNNGLVNDWLVAAFNLTARPLQIQQTIWMILLAHAFYNVSVIVRTVGGFWANLNPRLEEAAAMLGASRWQQFRRVTLPLLLPSITAAGLLVFLFCFTSFGVILILGGVRFATLEVEIYRQAISLFNLPVAAFLALVQLALTFTVMALYTRIQARAARPLDLSPVSVTQSRPPSRLGTVLLQVAVVGGVLLLVAPLVALAWRSFTLGGDGFTLQFYTELGANRRQSAFFVAPYIAIRNSVLYAMATVVLSLVLGIITAYLLARPRDWITAMLDPVFLLPLGVSAVTLGLGYIITMGPLRATVWLVPIAHTLIAAPFVVRTFLPTLRGLDPRLGEAAQVAGASPLRTWLEIDVPILRQAAIVGATFAFTISLGEFGATLLIGRPDVPTMPVVIYRALGQPGLLNYGQALAMSTILMAVTGLGLILIERFRLGHESEF